jgi:hypothetical protein
MTASPRTGALWSGIAVVAFLLGLVASGAAVGYLRSTFALDHGLGLAAWPILWGAIAGGGVLVGAHLVFTVGPTVRWRSLAVPAVGVVIAAILQLALHRYAIARFGVMDPDLLGPVTVLFALLVAVAAAAFGVEIAPRRAAAVPALTALVAGAGIVVIVAMHADGIADGVDPVAIPLGGALGAAGLYAAAIGIRAGRVLVARPVSRLRPRTSLSG